MSRVALHWVRGSGEIIDNFHFSAERFAAISQICQYQVDFDLGANENLTNSKIVDLIKEGALDFSDTMSYCMWRHKFNSCNEYFVPYLTEDGVCFTFNALDSREVFKDM